MLSIANARRLPRANHTSSAERSGRPRRHAPSASLVQSSCRKRAGLRATNINQLVMFLMAAKRFLITCRRG
jgi:hypothetical protein